VRPQTQKFRRNNADENEFGDCHRTCIAMILNMDRDDVPHFMEGVHPDTPADDPAWEACAQKERDWLRERGLSIVVIPYVGETPLEVLLEQLGKFAIDAPVILGVTSGNGCNHSVVVYNGKIYNPNEGTIAGPMKDGLWWLTLYVPGSNWDAIR
jgi:hypothetical protein